jgi:hypothetical protein
MLSWFTPQARVTESDERMARIPRPAVFSRLNWSQVYRPMPKTTAQAATRITRYQRWNWKRRAIANGTKISPSRPR